MQLQKGNRYDAANLKLSGWTTGDDSGVAGYNLHDYFSADGIYLGPDQHGIEPLVVIAAGCVPLPSEKREKRAGNP